MRFLYKLAVLAVSVGWGMEGRAAGVCASWLGDANAVGATLSNPASTNTISTPLIRFIRDVPTITLYSRVPPPEMSDRSLSREELEVSRTPPGVDIFHAVTHLTDKNAVLLQFVKGNNVATLEAHKNVKSEEGLALPMLVLFLRGTFQVGNILFETYSSYLRDDRDGSLYKVSVKVEFASEPGVTDTLPQWTSLHTSVLTVTKLQQTIRH